MKRKAEFKPFSLVFRDLSHHWDESMRNS